MVTISLTHSSNQIERIITDDPLLLGSWLKYTLSKLSREERLMQGNWYVEEWELRG